MSSLTNLKKKIKTLPTFLDEVNEWKKAGQSIIFTNGCFDLIHLGHLDYLSKAASLGDKFIIAVNSDASVSRLKGPNRPIKDEYTRLMVLASFFFVDAVILFGEETPASLIQSLSPDILVKGGDYSVHEVAGADHVMGSGGSIVLIPFLKGHSTSLLEKKIKG